MVKSRDRQEEFTAPRGSVVTGMLKFTGGASELTLGAAELDDDALYRARFDGLVPTVTAAGGAVTVRYPRHPHPFPLRRHSGWMTVDARLPWSVEITGGAGRVTADLAALPLRGMSLTGGASHVSVALPQPKGTVRVRVSGGASDISLRRPAGAAARLRVTGGASRLTFDDQYLAAVGGGLTLSDQAYEQAEDRYEIEVVGGVSAFTVDRP
ncbi:hypothetical protein [Streptomyces sp. Da 82-17]|uniref:hypothetical protein n=1 Tax=Streptomyces sp. Da 82-17 TaxID=3377116 RepID=UPI0038D3D82C